MEYFDAKSWDEVQEQSVVKATEIEKTSKIKLLTELISQQSDEYLNFL